MKKLSMTRINVLTISSFLGLAILLGSCKKFNDNDNQNTPVAGILAFNLAPDVSQAGILLSGNSLTNAPLAFNSYTGLYLSIYPGQRPVESVNLATSGSLATSTYSFEPEKYYSLFIVGADSTYSNVIVNDNFDSLSASSGQAFIRYINAIPDSSHPTVTIASGGSNVVNDNAAFKSVSEFKKISAGQVDIAVTNGGQINASRSITLEQNKVYTVLLSGIPGATGDNAVAVKFIANGTLDAEASRASSSAARAAN